MNEIPAGAIDVSAPWSWLASYFFDGDYPPADGAEFLLYSDSSFTGGPHFTVGPFTVTNCLADPRGRNLKPVLAVRLENHVPELSVPDMRKTDFEAWLNLDIEDEIACLISLVFAVRMRTGGRVRRFEVDGDPKGVPEFWSHLTPEIIPATRTIYPIAQQVSLDLLPEWIDKYFNLSRREAVILVRAARQFRDALWVADSDPELAWLLLVSALEVAANEYAKADLAPVELMKIESPELAGKLEAASEDLFEEVAKQVAPIMKATRRFSNFVEAFAPPPPAVRPEEVHRVDWERVVRSAKKVYAYRSSRLHEGVPFPAPMCVPPLIRDDVPEEKPIGLASSAGNATWLSKDLPMMLHTFGYLVQGCLMNWWKEKSEADKPE